MRRPRLLTLHNSALDHLCRSRDRRPARRRLGHRDGETSGEATDRPEPFLLALLPCLRLKKCLTFAAGGLVSMLTARAGQSSFGQGSPTMRLVASVGFFVS
jgi:hypothetical protein